MNEPTDEALMGIYTAASFPPDDSDRADYKAGLRAVYGAGLEDAASGLASFVHFEYGVQRTDGSVMRDSLMTRKESEAIAERHGFAPVRREVHMSEWEAASD